MVRCTMRTCGIPGGCRNWDPRRPTSPFRL